MFKVRPSQSLSFKIILLLVLTLFVVLSVMTYLNITSQQEKLATISHIWAERTSHIVKKALRYGMMQNHHENIWETVRDLGSGEDVDAIRIFSKTGTIRYSTEHSEVGRIINATAQRCSRCHKSDLRLVEPESPDYARTFGGPDGHRVFALFTPIENERGCWEAECHAHDSDDRYLGMLDVELSLAGIDRHVSEGLRFLIITMIVALLAVAAVSGLFVYVVVHKPVQNLIVGTKQIASGNLSHRIEVNNRNEISKLALSFNSMSDELGKARSELLAWSHTLEDKVVAKTEELQNARDQVVHMDKMASLGKLSSMIAHELNNPLSGILTFAKLSKKRLQNGTLDEEKIDSIVKDLSLISDEAKRCGDIVKNLLFFARSSTADHGSCDFRGIIAKSLQLVQHRIDMQQIETHIELPEKPVEFLCDANRLQQALLALFINAIEAMPEGGTLSVNLSSDIRTAVLAITDTGFGITASDRSRIFEPFYSTKTEGSGTGLGLSVAYGIIRHHDGHIHVKSVENHGSTFTIRLPIKHEESQTSG